MANKDDRLAAPGGVQETEQEAKAREERAKAQNDQGVDQKEVADTAIEAKEKELAAREARLAAREAEAKAMTARVPRHGAGFKARQKKNGTYVVAVSAKVESIEDLVAS